MTFCPLLELNENEFINPFCIESLRKNGGTTEVTMKSGMKHHTLEPVGGLLLRIEAFHRQHQKHRYARSQSVPETPSTVPPSTSG